MPVRAAGSEEGDESMTALAEDDPPLRLPPTPEDLRELAEAYLRHAPQGGTEQERRARATAERIVATLGPERESVWR